MYADVRRQWRWRRRKPKVAVFGGSPTHQVEKTSVEQNKKILKKKPKVHRRKFYLEEKGEKERAAAAAFRAFCTQIFFFPFK